MKPRKLLTEAQLKALPTGSRVFITYEHPSGEGNFKGVAFVYQTTGNKGCFISPRSKNSLFNFDWTYGDKGRTDESLCEDEGDDGEEFKIYNF